MSLSIPNQSSKLGSLRVSANILQVADRRADSRRPNPLAARAFKPALKPRLRTWLALALVAFSSARWSAQAGNPPPENLEKFRIAFSAGILGEVNRNDATAAILVWGQIVTGQRKLRTEAIPMVFDGSDELFSALQDGTIDAATVLTEEYFAHPLTAAPDGLFLGSKGGKITEQYVLLVRQGGTIQDIASLKGHSLELHQSPRTSLAPAWLDTLLALHKLGLLEDLFSKTTRLDKVSRVINRLFFRQSDACVVTREAFETAAELNPQVGKELRVLATSGEVVPSFFFFRAGLAPGLRKALEEAVLNVHTTAPGKQAMTVFQLERLEKHPLSCLDSARDLLVERARLRGTGQEKGKVAAITSDAHP